MNNNNIQTKEQNNSIESGKKVRWIVRFILPLCIVILAIFVAKYLMNTRPKAKRRTLPKQAKLVTVEPAQIISYTTKINATGTVNAAKKITIKPLVTGEIIYVSPDLIPGGVVQKGDKLIQIDSRDYEAIVNQHENEIAAAEMNLKLEKGNQEVAKQEYEMLDEEINEQDADLVLRKPQLKSAKAALESAKAKLNKAILDVQRCTIETPFNSKILDKLVDIGSVVNPSSSLLTIVGSDEYWIEILVPVNQLKWIQIPKNNGQEGSSVKIFNTYAWGENFYRKGTVIRLLGELEEKGRMAQLLVSVDDPLCLKNSKDKRLELLLDSYVQVEIEGQELDSVIPLKSEYIHNGNEIWIMNSDKKLEIRNANIVFRDKTNVYIQKGIEKGDQIITSDIAAPVVGMLLRLNGSEDEIEENTPKQMKNK